MFDELWKTILSSLAICIALFIVLLIILRVCYLFLEHFSLKKYNNLIKNPSTPLKIDDFVGASNPVSPVKVLLLNWLNVGNNKLEENPIKLRDEESPHVPELRVTKVLEDKKPEQSPLLNTPNDKDVIVVGTIRMGFGHHRIAYSAASWSIARGNTTLFHDFLGIDSPEAELIKSTDKLYSKFSRIASDMGGVVEKFWGKSMLAGDADALRVAGLFANHLRPLLMGIPDKDTPIITTHSFVGLTAVAAGFTNVINLVIDNHPQWFLLVPNALNLVQGPVNYQSFLKMGVPKSQLRLAGHWCPYELVTEIPNDCKRRIQRAQSKSATPRFLIPVGGAGAQRKFILSFLEALAPKLKSKALQIFLNAGDHKHMRVAFEELLKQEAIEYATVTTTDEVRSLQMKLLQSDHALKPVTLFTFDEYFPAVATTDIMCRVSDVLCSKPSELAFYPIPKLAIRRVGDHEAFSALRSAELGDGTCEAREVEQAMEFVEMMIQDDSDLLIQMNEKIIKNNQIGIYNGCQEAVNIAKEMHTSRKS